MLRKDVWEIECLHAGQPRAYADSYYEYIVHNGGDVEYAENVFKDLCTKFVYPVRPMDDPDRNWATPTWKLIKVDNRTYKYCVTSPYTD
jgi:hypothetical protein